MKQSLVFTHVIRAQLVVCLASGSDEMVARSRPWISVRVFITDITGRDCDEDDGRICVRDFYLLILGDTFAAGCNHHCQRFKTQSAFDAKGISINTTQHKNVVTVGRGSCFLWRLESRGEVQSVRSAGG